MMRYLKVLKGRKMEVETPWKWGGHQFLWNFRNPASKNLPLSVWTCLYKTVPYSTVNSKPYCCPKFALAVRKFTFHFRLKLKKSYFFTGCEKTGFFPPHMNQQKFVLFCFHVSIFLKLLIVCGAGLINTHKSLQGLNFLRLVPYLVALGKCCSSLPWQCVWSEFTCPEFLGFMQGVHIRLWNTNKTYTLPGKAQQVEKSCTFAHLNGKSTEI